MTMLRIDLHTRSSISDGAVGPAGLMMRASAAGLDVVALTDLNATAGLAEAAAALPAGLTLLPGVVISCALPDGDRRPAMDLLAYGARTEARDLAAMLHTTREGREQRSRQIVALLAAGV
ncbi:PHP domain-containing protein, partial [Frankia sp. AgKG'84/4]